MWVLYLKENWFRGDNPEYYMKSHLFTLTLRVFKKKEREIDLHWDYQLLFRPNKPVTQ